VLSGTKIVAANAGVATFSDLSLNKAAAGYTMIFTSLGLTATPASSTFTITAAAPTQIVFGQQPTTNTAAGAAITPAVTVLFLDQFSNQSPSTANVSVVLGGTIQSVTVTGGNTATI